MLVAPGQEDSLLILMQQRLIPLPVKARLVKKLMPVYVLRATDAASWKNSVAAVESSWGFSGRGFEGTAIPIKISSII